MTAIHPLNGSNLPDDWRLLTVDEIKSPVRHSCVAGPFGSSISSKYFVESGVPVIRGSNLSKNLVRFVENNFVFVSEEKANEHTPQQVVTNDLVFTCWGTIGQIGIIPHGSYYKKYIISNKQLKLRVNNEIADPLFIYFYFAGENGVRYVNSFAKGAAVPGISLGILKSLVVALPPLPTQRRIATILSTYDDLIENNTRRIEILEEMARRLYEEWFVRFRFPGHEETPLAPKAIGDIAEVIRGRSYKSIELVDEGGRSFVNLKCINRDGGFRRDALKRYSGRFKPQQLVRQGDIVMAVTDMTQERRIVARVGLVPDLGESDGVISMDLVKISPMQDMPSLFLYAALRWSDFADNVKNHATGVNVLHLHPDLIRDYQLRLPPIEICASYDELARPLFELCEALEKKNTNLLAQRNLLLPKLISGQIDVSQAEEMAEETAA